jgi:hypothetical protein
VGRYELPGGQVFTIAREGDRLYAVQSERIEIFPASERVFFLKVFDGQITFETDGAGPAKALILRQNSRNTRAPRISGNSNP